jgi:hypothetical protein
MQHQALSVSTSQARCLICRGDLAKTATVWCTDCDTPCHAECFSYNGKCSIFGCKGMRFRNSRDSSDRGVTWIETRSEAGLTIPQSYIVDFTSGRESAAQGLVITGLVLAFLPLGFACDSKSAGWLFSTYTAMYWMGTLGLAAFGQAIKLLLDDYYILDGKSRTILMHRRFIHFKSLEPVATFDDCRELVLSHQTSENDGNWSRTWTLWIFMRHSRKIQLLDEMSQGIGSHGAAVEVPPELMGTVSRVRQLTGLGYRLAKGW